MTQPAIDILSAEYQAWLETTGIPSDECGSALEMLQAAFSFGLSNEQIAWLIAFIDRWEDAADADDLFYDKQTTVVSIP